MLPRFASRFRPLAQCPYRAQDRAYPDGLLQWRPYVRFALCPPHARHHCPAHAAAPDVGRQCGGGSADEWPDSPHHPEPAALGAGAASAAALDLVDSSRPQRPVGPLAALWPAGRAERGLVQRAAVHGAEDLHAAERDTGGRQHAGVDAAAGSGAVRRAHCAARRAMRTPNSTRPSSSIHTGMLAATSVTFSGVEVFSAMYCSALYEPTLSTPSRPKRRQWAHRPLRARRIHQVQGSSRSSTSTQRSRFRVMGGIRPFISRPTTALPAHIRGGSVSRAMVAGVRRAEGEANIGAPL